VKRREFITLLGGAAATWPLAAHAQQGDRVRHVGVLTGSAQDDPDAQTRVAALRQGLQQLGWIEGRNLRIDARWGVGDAADTPASSVRCNHARRGGAFPGSELSRAGRISRRIAVPRPQVAGPQNRAATTLTARCGSDILLGTVLAPRGDGCHLDH